MSHVPRHRIRRPQRKRPARPILLSRIRFVLGLSLIALLVCGALILGASAQQNISPEDREAAFNLKANKLLKAVRRAADEDRLSAQAGQLSGDDSKLNRLSRLARVRRKGDGAASVGVIVRLTEAGTAELKAAGFAIGAHVGDIATVETDTEKLPELASLSSVRRIWASVYRHPLNDRARQAIGIDNSSRQRLVSQTGRGVVVGIIDSGIDFRHLDFTKPGSSGQQTRIKALLDMTVYGSQTPDPGWNYTLPGGTAPIGHLYTEADINAALQLPKPADQNSDTVKERDKSGHGTHVTGTAAGNGQAAASAPGTYAGMAPEADLVIVKASRENNGNDGFGTDDIINGLNFIKQKASELGEPFVINMSLGGHGGSPHDGTDPDERTIDNIVNNVAGSAVCVAAGNDGSVGDPSDPGVHASGNVTNGGTLTLNLNSTDNPQDFTLYYPNSDRFSITVTLPGNGGQLSSGPFNGNPTSNKYITIYNATDDKQDSDPTNDQSSIYIVINDGAQNLGANWTFTLHGDSVTSGGHFDAWVENGRFAAPYLDYSHLVSPPGTSRGAITVGAFVTRSATQTIGDKAFFTSPGPTADGRQKPDISAPGYYLYSTKSTDIDPTNGVTFTYGSGANATVDSVHYGGLAGTSMSTPVVTGAVALLLQANRNLSIGQIKQAIFNNAIHDNFTGAGWEPHFGNGKLNIAAAINSIAPPVVNQIDDTQFFVTQHYLDFLSRQPDQGGLAYWTNQIAQCGTNTSCTLRQRVAVSAAFFTSTEFQQSGYFVYRFYKAAFGKRPTYAEFLPDRSQVVGGADLEASKTAFANQFVARSAFTTQYPSSLTAAQYVDALNANTGGSLTPAERDALVNGLQSGAETRATALRKVADNQIFQQKEYNAAFVLMQYFGYLRRDPDEGGYQFWLGVMNGLDPSAFVGMTCAFITSAEYQLRFGTVTHTNADCGR